MQIHTNTVDQYIEQLPPERKAVIEKLREVLKANLPSGITETMSYGMIGYVVPHSIYPKGYHCDVKQPLPFINLASQKNFIALYHMGIYADKKLLDWFLAEYPKHCKTKPDMGKSCIRFKKMDDIPYELIGQLASKMTVEGWIAMYESAFVKK
jgi:uncharacterized protein YdhG (YjbR/CyaY superfamily)